jgi:hypothetical protein
VPIDFEIKYSALALAREGAKLMLVDIDSSGLDSTMPPRY